jgi:uncharacterized membrane protein YkvI
LLDRLQAIAAEFRKEREAWTGETLPGNATPHEDQEEKQTARHFRLGACTAAAFELLLTIFVSISALRIGKLLAGLIGIIVAILLALLVGSFLSITWNPRLPRASVRRLTRWGWFSFWVCIGGIAILLVTRTVPILAPVADVALAVLSLSLPVLAGTLFVLASIYDRFGRLVKEYEQVGRQVTELDQLVRQLKLSTRSSRRS